ETCFSVGRGEASGRPCFVTGTPIRDMSTIDRVAARERLGIGPAARVLLIFGGSQAVRRFNAAVAEALPRLIEQVHVLHLTGDAGYADALSGREALPPDMRERYRPDPVLRDEMLPALAAADLVVGRAGSSTLAEVTALGLPMVVVPYPHAAGHQRANARVLVEAGGASFVEDEDFDAEALLEAAEILHDPARHAAMSAASRALGRPGAADAVARRVLASVHPMRVGRPADLCAVADNTSGLRGLIKFARSRRLPHLVLGRGSNAVISDRGVRGVVIQDRAEGVEIRDNRLLAEAGLPMARAA